MDGQCWGTWPICQNWVKCAVLASMALLHHFCKDFMESLKHAGQPWVGFVDVNSNEQLCRIFFSWITKFRKHVCYTNISFSMVDILLIDFEIKSFHT